MKKGDTINGPAIVRWRYKNEWEYAFILPNNCFSPMGRTPPSSLKWVYQVTRNRGFQKIHRISPKDYEWGYRSEEKHCWWVKRLNAPDLIAERFPQTMTQHQGEPPTYDN